MMQELGHRRGWLAALAVAVATAEAATELLRPRHGILAGGPVAVEECFSHAELSRARRFGRPQLALAGAASIVEAGMLARIVRRAPSVLPGGKGRPLPAAALTGALLSLSLTAAPLPVSALMRKRALDVGLATQSWSAWAGDLVKSAAIGVPLSGAGAVLATALMRRYGERWWLPAAAAATAVAAGLTFAGPVVLDPLFNRFTPLADADTREDVLALARAAGVRVDNVCQVDASRRTTAANAYVNGLGATRRVVLFDTLLASFSREETRLVVAHELAHVRHRDVVRSLLQLALVAPAGLRAAGLLARRLDRSEAPAPAGVAALALAVAVVEAAVAPAGHRLSRAVERRADSFAIGLSDAPEAFVSFERRIVLANLADPDPPRWLTAVLGSHPSAIERIGMARAYAHRRDAEPTPGRTRRTPAGS